MTVIVGTLFLPYTVKFEVNSVDEGQANHELDFLSDSAEFDPSNALESNSLDPSQSILPSLSGANSSSPLNSEDSSPFATKHLDQDSTTNLFARPGIQPLVSSSSADVNNEQQRPQLVQPPSRFNTPLVSSSVIEKRTPVEGMPGLKFSRSGSFNGQSSSFSGKSGLHLGRSGSNSAYLEQNGKQSKLGGARQLFDLAINNNSNASIAIDDEEGSENMFKPRKTPDSRAPSDVIADLIEDEDEVTGKLAPYGGFSKNNLEEIVLGNENIFESAPWKVVKSDTGNGSLFNAIGLAESKGVVNRCKWVGAMSLPSDLIPQNVLKDIADHLNENYECESVLIDDLTFQGHYKSFCKQILWPTLHYQIPDDPKSKAFEEHSYHYYKMANQLVADRIAETYVREENHLDPKNPDNMIWIHDYHLLLVPAMVREKCPQAKIGFFLHVSFPSSEVFRCLAQRESLLKGLLGADCICFQNEEYVRHFLQTCSRLLLTDLNELGLIYRGRVTKVKAIPVGIDAAKLENTLKSEEVRHWTKLIRDRWQTQQLIVSRDKLDKLRGIKQKLLAYEKYLLKDRKRLETTVLLQIYMGEGKDDEYESEVLQIISRINSMADNLSAAQPVIVLHHDIDFEQYLALQTEADLFIVSSMREGLNLTCHEFIIATSEKKSPLVLSEFTGSSHLLDCDGKGAFLINPWDVSAFGETIGTALGISRKEKEIRWTNSHEVVLKHDSLDWVKLCLNAIQEGWTKNKEKTIASNKPFSKTVFHNFLHVTKQKNLIVINVDDFGAAAVNGSHEHKSTIELSRIGTNLAELLSDPKNYVFFASIMRRSELDLIFQNVPYVGLIAEFGGFMKFPESADWIAIINKDETVDGMNQVARMFLTKSQGLPGSKVVVNDCTVRLAAQTAMTQDPKRSMDVMGECVQLVNDSFGDAEGLHATIVNDSVVVQQKDTSLQAFKFLYFYYTGSLPVEALTRKFKIKKSESSANIFDADSEINSSQVNLPSVKERIDNLFYAGGLNPLDENIYDFISSLESDKSLGSSLTVAVWDGLKETRTSAKYVATGQNELLSIISDK